jgi:VWFA-related protein
MVSASRHWRDETMTRLVKQAVLLLALLSALCAMGQAATLEAQMMIKTLPANCADNPTPVTTLLPTDTSAHLWFRVSGAKTGDVASSEWTDPSGRIYSTSTLGGAWKPLTSDGRWCIHEELLIAGQPPASNPGTWKVKVTWNGTLLFTLQFTMGAGGAPSTGVVLESQMLTKALPANCTASYTTLPTPVTALLPTDPSVHLWFRVSGIKNGDVAVSEWTDPSGQVYAVAGSLGGAWETFDGSFANGCVHEELLIAGQPPASKQGAWKVKVTWNGALLFTLQFTIGTAGGGGGASGSNVIRNPGAEDGGPAASSCVVATAANLPSWKTAGGMALCGYGGDVATSDPGPADRGKNFFSGGFNAAASTAAQTVDVSGSAGAIDAGSQPYTLSGFLGGWSGQDDNATLTATFRSAAGATLGTAKIGPVLAAERKGATGMVLKSTTGNVPVGTRSIDVLLTITRSEGSYNDGIADNLSLTLSGSGGTPPPSGSGGLNLTVNQIITGNCPRISTIVSVTDNQGNPVTGLTASNFTVKEDGVVQSITVNQVGTSGGSGLSLAIVVDRSTSLSDSDLANMKAAAKGLVSKLGASDAVSVWAFSTGVDKLQDYTTDRTAINRAIDSIARTGSTALYAAVIQAAQSLAARSGRKAVVLMTDGEDNNSGGKTIDDAIAQAKLASSPVFPVGFGSANATILTRLANETGGVYKGAQSSADLSTLLSSLGTVISSQYEIIYTSSNPSINHTLDVSSASGSNTSSIVSRTYSACSASAAGAVLTIENAADRIGSALDVPVTLSATGTAPSTCQLDVGFDPSKVTYNSARKGDQLVNANKDLASNALSSTQNRFIAAGLNQNPIGNGTLFFMNYKLLGSTALTCTNAQCVDAQSKSIPTTCKVGTITASATCSCDVNGDGRVDVGDVQLIINQAMGVAAATCDLNGDGAVNVGDVQVVINAALGLGCKQ